MGILAGGSVLEASVLGIGERNGIADLFTTVKTLQDQGFDIRLNTGDTSTFRAYYAFVAAIVFEQTGVPLLTYNTPVFGDAVKTHVAGTHAKGQFGLAPDAQYHLNILCGKNLVKQYLALHNLYCPDASLDSLTRKIKLESARLNRCLTLNDVRLLVELE
jgi:2-isopropylmalate synthase